MNIPLLIVILYVLLLFGISIYVSYSQKKDSENFLLYKGKNNAFVVAASIAGLAIGGGNYRQSYVTVGDRRRFDGRYRGERLYRGAVGRLV